VGFGVMGASAGLGKKVTVRLDVENCYFLSEATPQAEYDTLHRYILVDLGIDQAVSERK
jgi:hypothetical protein